MTIICLIRAAYFFLCRFFENLTCTINFCGGRFSEKWPVEGITNERGVCCTIMIKTPFLFILFGLLLAQTSIAQTHFDTLGLKPWATPQEVRSAYLQKSKLNHPDKGGLASRFQSINAANSILSDEERRAAYTKNMQIKGDIPKGNVLSAAYQRRFNNYQMQPASTKMGGGLKAGGIPGKMRDGLRSVGSTRSAVGLVAGAAVGYGLLNSLLDGRKNQQTQLSTR